MHQESIFAELEPFWKFRLVIPPPKRGFKHRQDLVHPKACDYPEGSASTIKKHSQLAIRRVMHVQDIDIILMPKLGPDF